MTDKPTTHHVKVLLPVERADGTPEVESVWALATARGYRLDNIPFYARGYAWGDIVSARPDADGLLRSTGLVAPSGHSTIRLWFTDAGDVQNIRDELHAMRCDSELDLPRLVAVDIPPDVPYAQVRAYFEEKERAAMFEYEEACLGQQDPPPS